MEIALSVHHLLLRLGRVAATVATLLVAASAAAPAGALSDTVTLRSELQTVASAFDGRVGICAFDGMSAEPICVNGEQRFSLQSVMKLVVGAAAMDAIDRKGWKLDDPVIVRRQDLSLYVQPIAGLVAAQGEFKTTMGDLIFRAITQSDSAASDILFARLGGAPSIQAFLTENRAEGIRIDRDERHLQSDIVGLTWQPNYTDPDAFERALKAVPEKDRDIAYTAYMHDERDTATPKAMATFLYALAAGKLLSPASTRHLLDVLGKTVTFPDRLRAGAPAGWTVGHKTGTSNTWKGITAATNDVGILTAADGGIVAISAFVADSARSSKERAGVIAEAARLIAARYR